MENGLFLFGNIENKTIGGYTPAKLLMLRNDLWMGWYHAYGDGHTYMYMADEDSITSFSTGIAFIGEQEITTSNYDTMHNGIRFMLINPPLLIANDTIILSPDPKDGQEVLILYGGDISGDNPVVSAQVIYPNSGQTIVGIYPLATTTSTVISLKYKSVGSYWFVSAGGGSSATFDTTALSNRIDLKLNSADTASLSNRIDLKLNKTDTAGHWQPIGHLPIIVTVNATPSSVLTGTVTETNIASIKIPAGQLLTNGVLSSSLLFKMTGTTGAKTITLRLDSSPGTITGQTIVSSVQSNTALTTRFIDIDVYSASSTSQNTYPQLTAGAAAVAMSTTTINTANDWYLNISASIVTAGETVQLIGVRSIIYNQ